MVLSQKGQSLPVVPTMAKPPTRFISSTLNKAEVWVSHQLRLFITIDRNHWRPGTLGLSPIKGSLRTRWKEYDSYEVILDLPRLLIHILGWGSCCDPLASASKMERFHVWGTTTNWCSILVETILSISFHCRCILRNANILNSSSDLTLVLAAFHAWVDSAHRVKLVLSLPAFLSVITPTNNLTDAHRYMWKNSLLISHISLQNVCCKQLE